MLHGLASINNSSRRRFLTFAVAAATVIPLSEPAFAHDHSAKMIKESFAAAKDARTHKTIETAATLRELWLGHIFWVRNVSIAAIERLLSTKRLQMRKPLLRPSSRFMALLPKRASSNSLLGTMGR
jgi:hypothetical protein